VGDIIQFEWEENSCWGKAGKYKGQVRETKGVFELVYIDREKLSFTDDDIYNDTGHVDELESLLGWSEDVKIIGHCS